MLTPCPHHKTDSWPFESDLEPHGPQGLSHPPSTVGAFIASDVAQGKGWSSLGAQCFYNCYLWGQAPSKLSSPTAGGR